MHGRGTYRYVVPSAFAEFRTCIGTSWHPLTTEAEGDVYQGEWRDDKRHGKGVVTYAAASDMCSPEPQSFVCVLRVQDSLAKVSARGSVVEKFEGDWVNGKMHGHGKYPSALS